MPCEYGPPACLRPFVVDRQAGTTRRVPAPAIGTSQIVDTPGGPLVITYRVEAAGVFVSPDGTSVAVNASRIASVITSSTGYGPESWIYHRTLGRVTQHVAGEPFASWDGRRFTYNRFVQDDVVPGASACGTSSPGSTSRPPRSPRIALAFAGNVSADGRYVLFQTTEGRSPTTPTASPTSTCSIATPTATAWRPRGKRSSA